MTGSYFVNRALRKVQAIDPGRVASGLEIQDGLDTLNHMVDAWNAQKLLIWAETIFRAVFPSSKVSYTIGPAAGADFNTNRPVRIKTANMVFNQGANEVHIPVTILDTPDSKEWLAIPVQKVSTSIPLRMFYDNGFVSTPGAAPTLATPGLGTMYFNPFPAAPLPDLEFAAPVQIAQFDATTDYVFPPGYAEGIEFSLAERMKEFAGPGVDWEDIKQAAREARAVIASNASAPPRTTADLGLAVKPGRASFNWLTGNFN